MSLASSSVAAGEIIEKLSLKAPLLFKFESNCSNISSPGWRSSFSQAFSDYASLQTACWISMVDPSQDGYPAWHVDGPPKYEDAYAYKVWGVRRRWYTNLTYYMYSYGQENGQKFDGGTDPFAGNATYAPWDGTFMKQTQSCPSGMNFVYATDPSDAENEISYCIKQVVLRHPKNVCSSSFGNPINADTGSKNQNELDYDDPTGGILRFSRVYSSSVGGFIFGEVGSFLLPHMKGFSDGRGVNFNIVLDGQNLGVFYEYVSPGNFSGSALTQYRDLGDYPYSFTWNGDVGIPKEIYNKDRLIKDPKGNYQLSRREEGVVYTYDASGVLLKKTRNDGRFVDYTHVMAGDLFPSLFLSKITDNFGRTLKIAYDANYSLRSLTDPANRSINYTHAVVGQAQTVSSARMLIPLKVTYQDNYARKYGWNEASAKGNYATQLLTSITDESDKVLSIFSYKNGIATATERADGSYRYSINDTRVNGVGSITVTDPLETVRQQSYKVVGGYSRPTGWQQPGGSGCDASNSSIGYDDNGNVAWSVDFNGNKTCFASNDANQEIVRVDGLAKDADCAQVTSSEVGLGASYRKVTTAWHSDWSLKTRIAEPLKITTLVYNGQIDPFNGSKATCVLPAEVLPDGKPLAVICARHEQSTSDTNGMLGFSAKSTATRTWRYTYNTFGQITSILEPQLSLNDQLPHETKYSYYDTTKISAGIGYTRGDLKSVTNPLGQVTAFTSYDAAGRLLSSTDPNGTITTRAYTTRGWLKSVAVVTTTGVSQSTRYDYHPTGLLWRVTLPDGSTLTHTYDQAHRLTKVVDGAGNAVQYTLDAMGNRISEQVRDSSGILTRKITRVFDALGRLQNVTGAQH
ncbi:hypothetical protein VITFI_CDS3197 [Vitreoscilla filiformis]|uniref:RHS repeat protein n=1 Tax=Vitreoscilla filiformis TaxID=63 RepID=A0A221KIU7_VITFI|nr:hypothetical protein VITFI_CDS3197 [Vitreoscilla filiformis]